MQRSDSLELRRKVELIEKFLDEVVPKLAPQDSVDDAYDSFVSMERVAEINAFAQEIGLEIAKPNLTIVLPFGLVLGVVGLLLQGKIREFRIATRRDVEYDE